MADTFGVSLSGAQRRAAILKTELANSVLHLYKAPFSPTSGTTLLEFLAEECDFDGYAPIIVAAWTDPVLAPGSGYMILAGQRIWSWSHVTDDVSNNVGGYFLVTAGGVLMDYTRFDPVIPMSGPGQTVIRDPVEVVPAG